MVTVTVNCDIMILDGVYDKLSATKVFRRFYCFRGFVSVSVCRSFHTSANLVTRLVRT